MRLRAIIEAAILAIFLITVLMVILGFGGDNPPTDTEDGRSAEDYIQSGNLLYAAGRSKFSRAAVQYWEAVKRNPDIADAHIKLAAIYYYYIWNQQTLRELSEAERIAPDHPELSLIRGKIYHRMGDIDKAYKSLKRAVAGQPENSEVRFYLGIVYQQRSMTEAAINEYEKAIEGNSDDLSVLKAHLQLGRIYKTNDRERAKSEFRKAMNIDPTLKEAASELRNLYKQEAADYEKQGEYIKAAEKYENILKIDPDNPRNVGIYMQLGYIYKSYELYDKATVMYEAVAKFDPLNFDAFSELRALEFLRGMQR